MANMFGGTAINQEEVPEETAAPVSAVLPVVPAAAPASTNMFGGVSVGATTPEPEPEPDPPKPRKLTRLEQRQKNRGGIRQPKATPDIFEGLTDEAVAAARKMHPEFKFKTKSEIQAELPPKKRRGRGLYVTPTASRRKMANIERIRIENPWLASIIEEMSTAEATLIGVDKALEDVFISGPGRIMGLIDVEKLKKDTELYNKLKGVRDATGWGEFGTQAAMFIAPSAKASQAATLGGRIAGEMAVGGLEGSLGSLGKGETKAKALGTGLLMGGAGALGGEIISYAQRSGVAREVAQLRQQVDSLIPPKPIEGELMPRDVAPPTTTRLEDIPQLTPPGGTTRLDDIPQLPPPKDPRKAALETPEVKAAQAAVRAKQAEIPNEKERARSLLETTDDEIAAQEAKDLIDSFSVEDAVSERAKALLRDPEGADASVSKLFVDEIGELQTNVLAREVVAQGYDPRWISVAAKVNPTVKKQLHEMTKVRERGSRDLRYQDKNRSTDVIGEVMAAPMEHVARKKFEAGKAIDEIAERTLSDKPMNLKPIADNFLSTLGGKYRINIDPETGMLDFSRSEFRHTPAIQKSIQDVLDDVTPAQSINAFEAHDLKRAIDTLVKYGGKEEKGVKGRAKELLMGVRREINESLRTKSSEYATVNDQFSRNADVLEAFQKAVGSTLDLDSANIATALGTKSRELLGNRIGRSRLESAIAELDDVAAQYGFKSESDVSTLASYANELDRRFGAEASRSFLGESEKAAATGTANALAEMGADVALTGGMSTGEKVIRTALRKGLLRGNVNDKNAYKSMLDFLSKEPKAAKVSRQRAKKSVKKAAKKVKDAVADREKKVKSARNRRKDRMKKKKDKKDE